ncbi:hypothetical protein LMG31841_04986 [Paraburkholderia saeva]|uniref:Uncharacterized protein n=1 Tax=Paraburkholderia saeva TaxID=2777537 RepID=A0A9N8S143_9BURK|nr:hypothetical protein LMG31841_04986 [Paraburkholderia saeva]
MTQSGMADLDSQDIEQQQHRYQREEFRSAVRALLMNPLMSPGHEDFSAVRRQADVLREWFSRETGWALQIEREGARLGAHLAHQEHHRQTLPRALRMPDLVDARWPSAQSRSGR